MASESPSPPRLAFRGASARELAAAPGAFQAGGAGVQLDRLRGSVRAAAEIVTAPQARRTYLTTLIVVATGLAMLSLAALAYPVFYYSYIPRKMVSVPVHLQYNSGANPFAVTSVSRELMLETAYDVAVELTLPRSPPNVERGNFMVALLAIKTEVDNPAQSWQMPVADPYAALVGRDGGKDGGLGGDVVFSARRPVLVPYVDPVVARASRLLFLWYHVLFPGSESRQTLRVGMGELVEFRRHRGRPLTLLLDLQAGQSLQVYSARIELVARLKGFRWFMYNHRLLAFVAFTALFWCAEVAALLLAWSLGVLFLWSLRLMSRGGGEDGAGTRRGRIGAIKLHHQGARQGTGSGWATTTTSGSNAPEAKVEPAEDEDVKIKAEGEDSWDSAPPSYSAGGESAEGQGSLRKRTSLKGKRKGKGREGIQEEEEEEET